jgi:GTP-binding protein Era
MSYKSGFVALIGRPNVGKSTLINALLKHKIAIVSNKAQTTRNTIRGILTRETGQIVFIDTPGIHKPHHEMGRQLNRLAFSALEGVDMVYFIIDATKHFSEGDASVLTTISAQQLPIILVVNKIDQLSRNDLIQLLLRLEVLNGVVAIIPISALKHDNLTRLIDLTFEHLPLGEKLFEDEAALRYPEHFYISEIIREHILHATKQEVPHSVAVVIEDIKEDKKAMNIIASLIVERDSQKGILIGKQGQMLKAIGTQARQELTQRLKKPIYLDLLVKVDREWRNNQTRLKKYLHSDFDA